MVFEGWVYMCAYDLGFKVFLENVGFNPPHINYISFILFAGAIQVIGNAKSNESKQYSFNDMEAWGNVISIFITKFIVVFCLWLANIVLL